MLLWIFIGIMVGLALGLTGSGGGVMCLFLSTLLLKMNVRDASILSLIPVMAGSFFNLLRLKGKIEYRLSFKLIFFAFLASSLASYLKNIVPELFLVIFLTAVCLYSLYSFLSSLASRPPSSASALIPSNHFLKTILGGCALGFISTLGGLGGGIILMPLMLKNFQLSFEVALNSTLFCTILSALISLLLQHEKVVTMFHFQEIALLVAGNVMAVFLAEYLKHRMSNSLFLQLRKYSFVIIILLAIFSTWKQVLFN